MRASLGEIDLLAIADERDAQCDGPHWVDHVRYQDLSRYLRDVVLVKHDRESFYRFRCNSYADALCGSFLSRHLAGMRRR